MAVFRVPKHENFTVVSNHHLKDKTLSLKAKGLLTVMLSLPNEWDYSMRGLARICKEGVDSIGSTLRELEQHGYIERKRVRKSNGQLGDIEYFVYEVPQKPEREKPKRENPDQVFPELEDPEQETPAQSNTKESRTNKSRTKGAANGVTNPIQSASQAHLQTKIAINSMVYRNVMRDSIKSNIEYENMILDKDIDIRRLDEIVEIMVDTICSDSRQIRVAGSNYTSAIVKSQFMKLNSSHIRYVMDSMDKRTSNIRNIKRYLQTALYNAPITIDSHYTAQAQHDWYADDKEVD